MLVKFDIYYDDKFWCARGMGVDIFTQGKRPDELMKNVKDAVELYCEESLDAEEHRITIPLLK